MKMEAAYICRRCGKAYNVNEYLKSRFCEKCGTLLARKSTQPALGTDNANAEDKFEGLVKEFFPYASFRPFQLKAIKFAYET
ncbi:MAG: hypothetical protein QXY34_02980, partial [Candidatus Bathyarchaeia archaeon]